MFVVVENYINVPIVDLWVHQSLSVEFGGKTVSINQQMRLVEVISCDTRYASNWA